MQDSRSWIRAYLRYIHYYVSQNSSKYVSINYHPRIVQTVVCSKPPRPLPHVYYIYIRTHNSTMHQMALLMVYIHLYDIHGRVLLENQTFFI
jgi:hypothetical protein